MLTSLSTKSKKTVPPSHARKLLLTSVMTGVCLLENKKEKKELGNYYLQGTILTESVPSNGVPSSRAPVSVASVSPHANPVCF